MARPKGGLGRGLESLFADTGSTGGEQPGEVTTLPLAELEPDPSQPRKTFREETLSQLAKSIEENGLLQPIAVRPTLSGGYTIIAGERRWRAARMAGLSQAPVVGKELDDAQVMELALIENLQREDLTPLEEAEGYRSLMELYGMTQEQVARRVGKSRPVIANALRLLSLPEEVRRTLAEGKISAGHARVLAGVEDPEEAKALCQRTMRQHLSVRALERLAKAQKEKIRRKETASSPLWGDEDTFCREMELALQEALGRRVRITQKEGGGGTLELEFFSRPDLADLAKRLEE